MRIKIMAVLPCFLLMHSFLILLHAAPEKNMAEFSRAVAEYRKGNFMEARELFLALHSQYPESFEILYNLGCTSFKLSENGPALLYFARAQKLAPSEDDIDYNIRLISSRINDPDWNGTGFTGRLTEGPVKMAFGTALLFLSFVLALKIARPRKDLFWLLLASILFFSAGLTAFVMSYSERSRRFGVCMRPDTGVRSGPSQEFPVNFTIQEGKKARILAESGDWYEIGIRAQGVNGWVEKKQFEPV